AQQAFFEPRFGADCSRGRLYTDGSADTAAHAVGALAYTRGSDIVFRRDQYRPGTFAGGRMLAHELTHVVQQGAARGQFVQRWPGDGMSPPGDCGWGSYLVLRGAVETAKVIVDSLGGCTETDSCPLLATKIAAVTSEIAARVALDATCFKGGDTGHRQQVSDKLGMLKNCYIFFTRLKCPQAL